jgi:tetratricopeptide (TPR) repeat protein
MGLFIVSQSWSLFGGGEHRQRRLWAFSIVASILLLSLFAFPLQLPFTSSLFFLLLGAGIPPKSRPDFRLRAVYIPACLILLTIPLSLSFLRQSRLVDSERLSWIARHDQAAARYTGLDLGAVRLNPETLLLRALVGFDRALVANPINYRILLDRSRAYWDLGFGDEALRDLAQVQILHPNLVQAMLLESELRQIRRAPEDDDAVDALLGRASSTMPESPEVLLAQALWLLSKRIGEATIPEHRRIEARFQLERACKNREYLPDARILLANLLLDLGASADAVVPVLEKASQNASRSPQLLLKIARTYADPRLESYAPGLLGPKGRRAEALWKQALGLSMGQLPEAEVELRMPSIENHLQLGTPELQREALEALLSRIRAWSQLEPQSIFPVRHAALVYEALGQTTEAQVTWAKILMKLGRQSEDTPWSRRMMDDALSARERMANRQEKQ